MTAYAEMSPAAKARNNARSKANILRRNTALIAAAKNGPCVDCCPNCHAIRHHVETVNAR